MPQTFKDPDPELPDVINAASLALALMFKCKVHRWTEMPVEMYRTLEDCKVELTREQQRLIQNHRQALVYLTRKINVTIANPDPEMIKNITIGTCVNHPDEWFPTAGDAKKCLASPTCKTQDMKKASRLKLYGAD
jgi:hypothetical protein